MMLGKRGDMVDVDVKRVECGQRRLNVDLRLPIVNIPATLLILIRNVEIERLDCRLIVLVVRRSELEIADRNRSVADLDRLRRIGVDRRRYILLQYSQICLVQPGDSGERRETRGG